MLIATAHAQTQTAPAATMAPSPFVGMLPLLAIFVVFYFFLIRPQQKKYKEHQALVGGIQKGSKVILGGGIHGVVTKLEGDNDLLVEIAPTVVVKVVRATVVSILDAKPANDNK